LSCSRRVSELVRGPSVLLNMAAIVRPRQATEFSAKLLLLWAYFENEDIWCELLRHGDSSDPEWVSQLTEDEPSFK
jgi:hypothetical protein